MCCKAANLPCGVINYFSSSKAGEARQRSRLCRTLPLHRAPTTRRPWLLSRPPIGSSLGARASAQRTRRLGAATFPLRV